LHTRSLDKRFETGLLTALTLAACGGIKDVTTAKSNPGGAGMSGEGATGNTSAGQAPAAGAQSHNGGSSGAIGTGTAGKAEPQGEAGAPPAFEIGIGEAGVRCAEEGAQACEGHASRKPLRCDDGEWEALNLCEENERCSTAEGPEQGTCLPIPEECVGLEAGDQACKDNTQVACNVDLTGLDAIAGPCPQGYACDAAQGVSECADVNECETGTPCDQDPEATCKNLAGNYSCTCPSYFQGNGRGTGGCTDLNECLNNNGGCDAAPNACVNEIGTGHHCQCPDGFIGSGEQEDGCVCDDPESLPFRVLTQASPSGWFGDGPGMTLSNCGPSPADCFGVAWTPTPGATDKFVGIHWTPDRCFPPTAKLTFSARGKLGGEVVTFTSVPGNELKVTLTTSWTTYTLPASAAGGRGSPFGFSAITSATENANGVQFSLSNVMWQSN
jgi:hypothetical protein